jgi:hypothetical protein
LRLFLPAPATIRQVHALLGAAFDRGDKSVKKTAKILPELRLKVTFIFLFSNLRQLVANGLRYLRFAVVTRPKRAAARKASGARDVSLRPRFEGG